MLGAGGLIGTASGQSFAYDDFFDTTNLVLNGTAAPTGPWLLLTQGTAGAVASAFHGTPVDVTVPWETTFTFRIQDFLPGGGDGIAFVIQGAPAGPAAIGATGAALGYASLPGAPPTGIPNSLAIELDVVADVAFSDPDGNHVSVHTQGPAPNSANELATLGVVGPAIDLGDGLPHVLRVTYEPGTLAVFLDDLGTPLLTVPYDLVRGGTYALSGMPAPGLDLPRGEAFVGFTAAAGLPAQDHLILAWSWRSASMASTCLPASPNTTGVPATLATSSFGAPTFPFLWLEATDGPPSEFGFFLVSPNGGATLPVFDGVLCLATPQGRYDALAGQAQPGRNSLGQFDATGRFRNLTGTSPTGVGFVVPPSLPPALAPATTIAPGDTLTFQLWYRDSVATPGDTANFSDALRVTF